METKKPKDKLLSAALQEKYALGYITGRAEALQDVENIIDKQQEKCLKQFGFRNLEGLKAQISQLKDLTTAPIADGKAIHSKLLDCNRRLIKRQEKKT